MDPTPSDPSPAVSGETSVHANGIAPPGPNGSERRSLAVRLAQRLLPHVGVSLRITLWNGEEFVTAPGPPVAGVRIHDPRAVVQMLLNPDLGFGDAYGEGRVEVEGDLVLFLESLFRARRIWGGPTLRRRLASWLVGSGDNDPKRSRHNVHSHYDLGNEFYRLWLDDQLVYTCAYFPSPDLTLEEAQVAKMDHVCRKVGLRPGEAVVEAGCGWGALALHMARHYGVTVTAYNLSREQVAYARERARAEGLDGRVVFVEDDYRAIRGRFDAFVSVGMLEHVGRSRYHDLGSVIHRCLKPTGRGLIHSIGQNRGGVTNSWLVKRIFPGAYLPSLREMTAVFEPWQFSVLDVENLRLHYARTLEHWLRRFERVADRARAMFDAAFVRAWRLYLASSLAGFSTGFIQLFQVVFAPANNNDIPWTRLPIYEQEARSLRELGKAPRHGDL